MPRKFTIFIARACLVVVPLAILADLWFDLGIENFGWKLFWSIVTVFVSLGLWNNIKADEEREDKLY